MHTPIPDLYQVKWLQNGYMQYGIVSRWDPESIKYYAAGRQVIINDALTPDQYVVSVDVLTPVTMSFRPPDEYTQHVEEHYRSAKAYANSLPDGLQVGKLFVVPKGDGYAHYVVTKVNKKTVDIEWRGYGLDRWVDDRFGYGGREKRETIEMFVAREDARRRIFSTC
jgi:hypothetical protein